MGLNNRTGIGLAWLTLARLGFALLGLEMMGSARVGLSSHRWIRVSLACLGLAPLCYARVLVISRQRGFCTHFESVLPLHCFIVALLYCCFASSLCCFIAFAILQALQASYLLSCDLLRWKNNFFQFATICHSGGTTFFYCRQSIMAEEQYFLFATVCNSVCNYL